MNHDTLSPLGLEVKYAPLAPQTSDEATAISGHASVFGAPDQNGDIVEAGAFAASLERLAAEGRSIKLLWQHDPVQPIGIWDQVAEDGLGLFVKGRLLTEIEKGADAAALLAFGAVDGLSIGYRTVRAESLPGGGRRLLELDLWEVSLVTFPMLPAARALAQTPDPEADLAMLLSDALAEARAEFA